VLQPGRDGLLRSLSKVLGGDTSAEMFLRDVLDEAGLSTVPQGQEPFAMFVREELLPRLMPLIRLERVHDFVRRTIGDEASLHPAPLKSHGSTPGEQRKGRARVVVVEPDAMRRVSASRALVREFDVEVVATAEEVLRVDAFHAIVLGLNASGAKVVEELARNKTRAGLVVYDEPATRLALRRAIDVWPNDRVSTLSRDASSAVLCARVRIVVD
jgi:hypothetical protein